MTTVTVIVLAVVGLALVGVILKRTARAATIAAVALLLALLGYYVWPTPFRFYSPSGRLAGIMAYRENRFTGSVDVLTRRGWIRLSETVGASSATATRAAEAQVRQDSADLLDEFKRERQRARASTDSAKRRP